jgi:chromosome segregation ATPase
MKGFQFNDDKDNLTGQQFHFEFPNGNSFGQSYSKVIIKNDGKKPLVIENDTITEGGDDYTKEELEDIKKNNKVESYSNTEIPDFSGNNLGNLSEQMKKMQEQIDQMMSQQSFARPDKSDKMKSELDNSKEEMLKAKEEMKKAKEEMENAKKELEKAKSTLKTQKA